MSAYKITLKKIVKFWLEQNGYDGLCEPDTECGCGVSDFMPCEEPNTKCIAAYKWKNGFYHSDKEQP